MNPKTLEKIGIVIREIYRQKLGEACQNELKTAISFLEQVFPDFNSEIMGIAGILTKTVPPPIPDIPLCLWKIQLENRVSAWIIELHFNRSILLSLRSQTLERLLPRFAECCTAFTNLRVNWEVLENAIPPNRYLRDLAKIFYDIPWQKKHEGSLDRSFFVEEGIEIEEVFYANNWQDIQTAREYFAETPEENRHVWWIDAPMRYIAVTKPLEKNR